MHRVVSIIGGRNCKPGVERIAHQLGKSMAKVVDICVSGGLGGVMEAVSRGFKESGGKATIGILPSYCKSDANRYIDVAIPSGLGLARNVLVVTSGDVVIALPGESGTLSEIAYCLQFGIPVISLKSWDIPGVIRVDSVDQAVRMCRSLLRDESGKDNVRRPFLRRSPWQRKKMQKK